MRTLGFTMLLIGCFGAAGCVSPESTRARGGDRGADVGNRSQIVEMHGGSDPFFDTPERIKVHHPPLASARQAEQLSRE
jgi:hypothetical protein